MQHFRLSRGSFAEEKEMKEQTQQYHRLILISRYVRVCVFFSSFIYDSIRSATPSFSFFFYLLKEKQSISMPFYVDRVSRLADKMSCFIQGKRKKSKRQRKGERERKK